MELFDLPFLKIIKLGDDLIEVITHEGVELDTGMMEQYHTWIRNKLKHPCYILVNKINAYSYSFEVQQNLSTIPEIKAIALLVYTQASQLATESLQDMPRQKPWNSKVFSSREEALQWLEAQRTE